jgi:hypothetical protein
MRKITPFLWFDDDLEQAPEMMTQVKLDVAALERAADG